ncbi:nxf4 [Drosophila busckii]|uniref:Nxf4 n=1 Tax=Drosophila busckii TaxID=30019 RepID=A0A0M4EJC1_DROBS|nr:nuclear RNA export factor 1 [Drosophila busckii]XP_017846339.1 nuclear RNA export factor 1 [Drosophila busckii]ALC46971.1 nxf4 [Drosophila busckii]
MELDENDAKSTQCLPAIEWSVREACPESLPRLHRPLPISHHGWYRVVVFTMLTPPEVLRQLQWHLMIRKLRYYYFHEGGEEDVAEDEHASFTFYVKSYKLANALLQRGQHLALAILRVSDKPPQLQVDAAYRWKLRKLLLLRYDEKRRSLNLRRFYADKHWRREFCALQQFELLEACFEIMAQELPQLRHLRLDHNYLVHLGAFSGVEQLLPQLKSISLRRNELNDVRLLSMLQPLHITELNVRRNPLPRNYKQQLLQMLPQLRKLNGHRIRIRVSSELKLLPNVKPELLLPEFKAAYVTKRARGLIAKIRGLVLLYLRAFDRSDCCKRHLTLKRFYQKPALFSLSFSKQLASILPYAAWAKKQLVSRYELLCMFERWPQTKHLLPTLTLDVMLFRPLMLQLVLTGCYNETLGKLKLRRYFVRNLWLTRDDEQSAFRIANELMYLGRPELLSRSQRAARAKLAANTRMNKRWACKLLEDTNWDYQQALLAFKQLQSQRQIPDKAFTKESEPCALCVENSQCVCKGN